MTYAYVQELGLQESICVAEWPSRPCPIFSNLTCDDVRSLREIEAVRIESNRLGGEDSVDGWTLRVIGLGKRRRSGEREADRAIANASKRGDVRGDLDEDGELARELSSAI